MVDGRDLLRPTEEGGWELRLSDGERELLAMLADQLDQAVESEPADPGVARLFPAAYRDDVAYEAEWQVFRAAELRSSLAEHLAVLRSCVAQPVLSEDELIAWMQAVNALRLVLGTRLDVDEEDRPIDPDDPNAIQHELYDFLGFLVHWTIEALNP